MGKGEGGQRGGGGRGGKSNELKSELMKMLLKYREKGGVCGCAILCEFAEVVGAGVLLTELVLVCVFIISL